MRQAPVSASCATPMPVRFPSMAAKGFHRHFVYDSQRLSRIGPRVFREPGAPEMERRAVRLAKTETPGASASDSHLADLRSTLAWLKLRGDLIESEREINPDLELTGLQKLMDGGCPALFSNVKGKPSHRLLTNLFGNIEVMNRMFGWESDKDRTVRLAQALNRPLPPQEIAQGDAPCQE